MYERFTDRGRKVMQLANQEAQRFNHEYVGTEHILLGLVKEGTGVAANVLKNLDIDLRKIRLEVEKIVQSGPDMVTMGKLPQTPRAKKVIEYSIEEARNLNHNYVGTEHLLLGLLREQEGVAAQVLMNLGLELKVVREEVLTVLGANSDVSNPLRTSTDSPTVHDLSTPFMYLPEEVIQALEDIGERFQKIVLDKQEAIAEQDFEKAAGFRDKEHELKRRVLDAIKHLKTSIREWDSE
jgi:ATP-dependent Clp protease ATP-binding subunit ClpA